MYIPTFNREDDPDTLLAFMQAHSFVTIVSSLQGSLIASHIPVVTQKCEEAIVVTGHLARANPHVEALTGEALVIFSGPHAYVSPKNYAKPESVPTWNYVAVHAYGQPRTITFKEQPEQMLEAMAELIAQYEVGYQAQWDGLSETYRHGMMRGIVGFELQVERLEGKYKLSQNRPVSDQQEVARALLAQPDSAATEVAALMQARLERLEDDS